ncbi:integrase/transposase [Paraoerskovia sediminicola]|uniref:Integrase/transposase n=1 Tax=Paraoerskovia sediminicola TaxID=1138587 RepID=A0ABM8G2W4_9CELL|nr:integrase [Paraoerskovia sediminicola]BDZ42462.1 integrase/transposase [Paraoerskovia sediminicola]
MRERQVTSLKVGSRTWWHGDYWEVRGFVDGFVQLGLRDQAATVAITDLARYSLDEPECTEHVDGTVDGTAALASLTADERDRVEALAAIIRSLVDDPAPLAPRIRAAAKKLDMSHRTLERRIAAYRQLGVAGLVDSRAMGTRASRIDPRWDDACLKVLRGHTYASTPTKSAVIAQIARELIETYGPDVVPMPHPASAYRRIDRLSKGRYTFGSASGRRSAAERPTGVLGRLRADRPGQYVVLDTNDLDVFAMEPVTLRWVKVQLTAAMDLYSRCIVGLKVTPVSTKAIDVASVLYECVRPADEADPRVSFPYHGVPDAVLVGTEVPDERLLSRQAGLPAVFAESIVVDRGKQYISSHVVSACARLGISVQPANPKKPTDKPTIERFFRTLREGLLQHLPAYKGPNVYSRGRDVEGQAFLWVSELEQIIREWVTTVYHQSSHDGLAVPELPRASLSPIDAYNLGLARAGGMVLPAHAGLAYEFLDVQWRTIQHYGVDIGGLRYDGKALNAYRGRRSEFTGKYPGKWPFYVDAHDVRHVHFKDPADGAWHSLRWEHAPALGAPMSQDSVDYVKRLALREDRHVEPQSALDDLLRRWARDAVTDRRERNLAIRLSAQRDAPLPEEPTAAEKVAALPSVVNLADERSARRPEIEEDELSVFEEFPPDELGYAVIDE